MERVMLATNIYDSFRRQVLKQEHLADPSIFFRTGFFDEIPLYSRYEQVEPFVGKTSTPDVLLLGLALDYLEEVASYAKARSTFLAAITILDDRDFDQIVPNVFVCHGRVKQRFAT